MIAHDATSTFAAGLSLRELVLPVPLDREDPERASLHVFARVITADGGAERPFLLYLQGGPGSEAPRPAGDPLAPPWLQRALRDFRVVMLDQRGTGRSTPVGLDTAAPGLRGADGPGMSSARLRDAKPEDQAEYLTHFRADEIVEDAEDLRRALGIEQWSLLGQSFGGFCTLRYLSAHPGSVREALFTGGLGAVGTGLDDVYAITWQRMIEASERHWDRFPADRAVMRDLSQRAQEGRLTLPDGTLVSCEQLRSVGHLLGASGGSDRLHWLLELDPASPAFAHDLAAAMPFGGRNPLYAVLQESCWADGFATRWAAERTMPEAVREDPTLLAGEHIHPSVFDEDPQLTPWKDAALILAEHPWPRLYEAEALCAAEVPGAAAVYFSDVYVPREPSLATAALMPGVTPWVTSEYEHNGLRAGGERVLDHLLDLSRGRALR